MRTLGQNLWWSVFGIGILLGAIVFGMRLFIVDAKAGGEAIYYEQVSMGAVPPGDVSLVESNRQNPGREAIDGSARDAQEQRSSDGSAQDEQEQRSNDDKDRQPEGSETRDALDVPSAEQQALADLQVRVYLTERRVVETVPLDTYVEGVLAGEMPADFELEALKAQAIAARTYIIRRLVQQADEGKKQRSDVTDTIQHQVYISQAELETRWRGEDGERKRAKLQQAVTETSGQIITYDDEPIEAAFFSTSNGFTENSEDYWTASLPYLRSVASPWDEEVSPRYEQQMTIKRKSFYQALGLSGKSAKAKPVIKVTQKTEGNRIKEISINGSKFSGREVRERLGLASSQFSWKVDKDVITITTYGLGHGVGMSQWGANGMAMEGKKAEQILRHYYTGIDIEQASKLPFGSKLSLLYTKK